MRLTLTSCGDEIAPLDADPVWQLQDVLMTLPERFRETGCCVRVLFGTVELGGQATLSDIGASSRAVLTIVRSKLSLILTASRDGTAKIWSAASGQCLQTLTGHGFDVNTAVFSPDGERVLTASNDSSAKIWSAGESSEQCVSLRRSDKLRSKLTTELAKTIDKCFSAMPVR